MAVNMESINIRAPLKRQGNLLKPVLRWINEMNFCVGW